MRQELTTNLTEATIPEAPCLGLVHTVELPSSLPKGRKHLGIA